MSRELRISPALLAVLTELLQGDTRGEQLHGYALIKATGYQSGTIYPILKRLEKAGWVHRQKEEIDEWKEHRRARVFYQLSEVGVGEARAIIESTRQLLRQLDPT